MPLRRAERRAVKTSPGGPPEGPGENDGQARGFLAESTKGRAGGPAGIGLSYVPAAENRTNGFILQGGAAR